MLFDMSGGGGLLGGVDPATLSAWFLIGLLYTPVLIIQIHQEIRNDQLSPLSMTLFPGRCCASLSWSCLSPWQKPMEERTSMYNFREPSESPMIAQRVFSQQDQDWFAACSGDFNPVHTDPVAARRELPGDVVVHGVHQALWALNAFCAILAGQNIPAIRLTRLKCSFRNPAYLGLPIEVRISSEQESRAKLAVVQSDHTACQISLAWETVDSQRQEPTVPAPSRPWERRAADEPFESLSGKQGSTPLEMDTEEIRHRYPALLRTIGPDWTCELLAITRVIGMESPGLHSMLSAIDLVAQTEPRTSP